MKNTKNALLFALSVMLCFAVASCGSSGGAAAAGSEFGEGIPFVGELNIFSDVNDGGDSTIEMEEIEVDGITAWRITGNVTTAFQYGFVGWMYEPDEATLEALKTARAISFMYVGDGQRMTVKYRISTVTDHAFHEYNFTGEAGVVDRLEVPIRFFQQPSWGAGTRMVQANAVDISWQTHESWRPGPFEITIWDVRIHP
ncbi:MAG: CIA30 family protein, partial [Treponema sp.]|nr:CIA30 family protein [Treponema sp.]